MDLQEACRAMRMAQSQQRLAMRAAEVFVDIGTRENSAPIMALHVLDRTAKQIAVSLDLPVTTVSKITLRETQRLGESGRGSLAFRIAASPKMLRCIVHGLDANGTEDHENG